jgi:hypothetical protein
MELESNSSDLGMELESNSSDLGMELESNSSDLGTELESNSLDLGTGRWLTRQVQTRPNLKIWTPALFPRTTLYT